MTHLRFLGAAALLGLALPGCSGACPESYDCFLGEFSLAFGGGLSPADVDSITTSAACSPIPSGSCDAGVSSCGFQVDGTMIEFSADDIGDCAITLHLKTGEVIDTTAHITEITGACCSGLTGAAPVVVPKQP